MENKNSNDNIIKNLIEMDSKQQNIEQNINKNDNKIKNISSNVSRKNKCNKTSFELKHTNILNREKRRVSYFIFII